jgi:hypothetical protein
LIRARCGEHVETEETHQERDENATRHDQVTISRPDYRDPDNIPRGAEPSFETVVE